MKKNEREPPFLQRFPLVRGLPSKMSFSKTCYPVALFPKGCLELVSQNCFPPHLVLKCCTCLVYLFSKGFSWGTFFPKVSCGSTFFPKVSCGATFFPKVSCGALFSQLPLSAATFFPKVYFLDLALAALEAMLPALLANCFNSFIVSFTSLALLAVS